MSYEITVRSNLISYQVWLQVLPGHASSVFFFFFFFFFFSFCLKKKKKKKKKKKRKKEKKPIDLSSELNCILPNDKREEIVTRLPLRYFSSLRGTSVRIRFGSPFSSKVVVCGHCLVTLYLTIMKH